jgi:parallel beta-helix repeat protein
MRTRAIFVALGLVVAALPILPARAATEVVHIHDNFFEPREITIDPGDTVTWDGGGFRPHTVTSDTGLFKSGQMSSSDEFSHTFPKAGVYYYHCRFHGAAQAGMWGVVVVGDPPRDERERIVVPDDYPTIQAAVSAAQSGASIVVRPGTYEETVVVVTEDLVIRGLDRFRTVLHGGDSLGIGIEVRGAADVVIKDLTVRDYLDAGIRFDQSDDFAVKRVDVINNSTFGVDVTTSHGGTIERSFAWGSGGAGFRVGPCFACGILVDRVRAEMNLLGVETVNATGVTVRASKLRRNGVGMLARSYQTVVSRPGGALYVTGNNIDENNIRSIPPSGAAASIGYPFGTGIWLAGVSNSAVQNNEISGNERYGVLVTDDLDHLLAPVNNRVQGNAVSGPASSLDLAWDGSGASNCFQDNAVSTSAPPSIQDLFACRLRPFQGEVYEPVKDAVAAAIAGGPQTLTEEPGDPLRPLCQRGRPGCGR